jgi:hypothetical protein
VTNVLVVNNNVPVSFGRFIGTEIDKWASVIRAADLKAE